MRWRLVKGLWVGLMLVAVGSKLSAQRAELNTYVYVLVPDRFAFQNESNAYNLNALFKVYLKQKGFEAFLSSEDLPLEMTRSKCSFLTLHASKSGFLNTKIQWSLRDCNQEVLYTSPEGISKEKDLLVAIREAVGASFADFDRVHYQYSGTKPVPVGDSTDSPPEVAPEVKTLQDKSNDNPELFYFAQPIANGFQVVDSTPRVIMRLFHTSARNIFIGIKGDTPGVLFQKNNQWYFEYYEQGKLQSVLMQIKF